VAGERFGSPSWGLTPGAVVAGYRVEARIGAGGMAVVFRARDVRLGRTVALKILAPALAEDREFRERFIRESWASAAVDHPHIVPVYAADEADGVLYIAMRYVSSGDLRELIRRDGQLTAERASRLMLPLASALDAGHLAGLVHRDVKPANILVDTSSGLADHPYLADFGLAKGLGSTTGLTGTGQFIGTLDYTAPEQISGKRAVPQTDQYALACAAFTMLAGAPPFPREEPTAVLWAHISEPPPPVTALRPDLPPGIDQVLARAMAKTPEERYRTCTELAEAFRTALGVGTLGFGVYSPIERTPGLPSFTSAAPAAADIPVPGSMPPAVLPVPAADLPAPLAPPGLPVSASYADTVTSLPPGSAAHQAGELRDGWDLNSDLAVPPLPLGVDFTAGRSAGDAAPGFGVPAAGAGWSQTRRPQWRRIGNRRWRGGLYNVRLTQTGLADRRKGRRRVPVIATVASMVVVGGGGAALAVHMWLQPPVLRPTGLAVQGKTTSSLTIDWSGPTTGPRPDKYEILRDSRVIGTVPGTVTNYTDSGLAPGSPYHYQVIAVRGGGQSPFSRPLTGQTALLQPTGLAVQGKTTNSLTIDWAGPGVGPLPDTYEILRDGTVIGTVPGTVTNYTDSGLAPGSPYHYQVIAVRGGHQSLVSQPLSGRTTAPPLADARLDWSNSITYTLQWLSPLDSKSNKQPGDKWQDSWSFTPRCSSGPCDVRLNGAYDGWPFTTTLTRSGTTYSGTAEIKGYWYCETPSDAVVVTLTITITAKSAAAQGTQWVVNSFSGAATLYAPAAYTCHDDTFQLAVRS